MENRINFVFIRHPETEGNVLSNSDATKLSRPNHMFRLTPTGLKQMDLVFEEYQTKVSRRPHSIYCSTFSRTRILAKKFAKHYKMPIIEDSRLDEKWDGIFHSLPEEEIQQKYPEQINLCRKIGWYHFTPLGGENAIAVEMRIRSFLMDFDKPDLNTTILVACHGNWLHLFEKIAKGLTWKETEEAKFKNPFQNCSITQYNFLPPKSFNQEGCLDRYSPLAKTIKNNYT